ncbi:MAG: 3'-5' exonuclease [Chloroflexota bacterium]|nr:3'-5' exonuclease [Chloroflexota bacterium]
MSDYTDAIDWAADILRRNPLILDTETTGLQDGEIVQISVIDRAGIVHLNTLVKPVHGIPQDASDVHGITEEMVAAAPGWGRVSYDLIKLLAGRDVVIYNAVYDRKMMHRSAEHAGLPKVDWKQLATFHCAMEMYAQFFGNWNSYRKSYTWVALSRACQNENVDLSKITAPAHSALGDCLRTLALIEAMAQAKK